MIRIVLIVIFALPFSLLAQTPLEFVGEKIDFEINNQRFSVNGVYYFLNNSEMEKKQAILFPFYEKPDSLIVKRVYDLTYSENIEFKYSEDAIVFKMIALPGDTVKINIAYSQKTMKENVYILESTLTWKKALKYADYSLTFDNSVQIDSISLQPDLLSSNVYYWTKKNFLPGDNFKVWIK